MTDISRLPGPQSDLWEWQLQGACRGKDTELLFHPEGERRAHALAAREPYGVWGGLSEHEREAVHARGALTTHAAAS